MLEQDLQAYLDKMINELMDYKELVRAIGMTLNQGQGNITQEEKNYVLTYNFHSGETHQAIIPQEKIKGIQKILDGTATLVERFEILNSKLGVINLNEQTYQTQQLNVGEDK